jgi:hypothetical protein
MWCRPGQTNLLLPSHLSSFRLSRKPPIIAITQTITLIPHSQHWRTNIESVVKIVNLDWYVAQVVSYTLHAHYFLFDMSINYGSSR